MSSSLTFVVPPPGLSPLTDFTLHEVAGAPGLYSMVADLSNHIRLYLVDAGVYLPNYPPVITDEQASELRLTSPGEVMVLVVANPTATGTTVNLMAPIVVNSSTGESAQLILDGADWPLQARLDAQAA